ncbi:MAG: hypothetical protein RL497_1571 [Pseudomonadota bacterium]
MDIFEDIANIEKFRPKGVTLDYVEEPVARSP